MIIGLDITVLNDKRRTGVAVYAYNLIDALLKQSRDDEFVLFGFSTLETYKFLKNIEFKNHENVKLKVVKMPARFFRMAFILWQNLDFPPINWFIGRVDVFLSFNFYLPPQKSGKKAAVVFDLTSIVHPEWHINRTTQLDKIRMRRISESADLIIAISENTKKDFERIYPGRHVEVIYPAVADVFKKEVEKISRDKVMKKYGLDNSYILSVATLEPRKNLKRLIDAYLRADLDSDLVLVGAAGWKYEQIKGGVSGKEGKIKFLGFVEDEDLPLIYSGAVCLVYPSLYEGFGIPVLEALELGVPVIVSKISSLPEVAGEAAEYVDPLSVDSITGALKRITKNKKLRDCLRKKGISQSRKFSWEKSARELSLIFHRLSKPELK